LRRKKNELITIEVEILNAWKDSTAPIHGYLMAKEIWGEERGSQLLSTGALYKALRRMKNSGLIERSLEDPTVVLPEYGPLRRPYQISEKGRAELERALLAREN